MFSRSFILATGCVAPSRSKVSAREHVAVDDGVGAHVRRALRASDEHQLAEGHARRERGDSLRLAGVAMDEDAHAPLGRRILDRTPASPYVERTAERDGRLELFEQLL